VADEDAFTSLVEPHRAELRAHCYRMLGSVHDADDALQETMLRAWRALPRFGGERRLRPWLYRIATNVCLDALAQRPKRALTVELGPPVDAQAELGDPYAADTLVEPYPAGPEASYEALEAVELA
jgi:RNA polymerase sigma-70 factor, ECF subfamily